MNGPLMEEGTWYGVQTRVLSRDERFSLGDAATQFFVEFEVELERAPLLARLDFLVRQLNVVESMEVRINGEPAGKVTLHLPGIQDANYMLFRVNQIAEGGESLTCDEKYAMDYGPWARAWVVFDGALLRPGRNTIAIGKPGRLWGSNDDYDLKDVRLQLKYPWSKDP